MIKGTKDWVPPSELKDLLLESALLPVLEGALRNGSLLEMAKDYELYIAYLNFIEHLSSSPEYIDILTELGPEY